MDFDKQMETSILAFCSSVLLGLFLARVRTRDECGGPVPTSFPEVSVCALALRRPS